MKNVLKGIGIVLAGALVAGGLGSIAYSASATPVTIVFGSPAAPVSNSNPLPVSGTFSASLSGFTPGGTFATLTATASSASVALPAGVTVFLQNTGTTTVSCTLGVGSATALASEIQVPAGSGVPVVVGSNTWGACIDQTGSASNLVVLAGGSGLGTPFGGGGSGGGAVTLASSAVASGAYSSGSIASGAYASGSIGSGAVASGAFASGSLASGAGTDGWDVTEGAKADAAWVSGSGSLVAIAKTIANNTGAAIPAGSAIIGKVGIDQTTPGTTNGAAIVGVNAATALAGAGAVGTGSLRVAVGQDTTTVAGSAPGTAGTASGNVVTVQGVASMTPVTTTVNVGTATSTQTKVTITTASTYQQYLASNAARKGCTIQFITAAHTGYVFFGAAPGDTTTSFQLSPGQTINCTNSNGLVLTDAIQLTSSNNSDVFVVNSF